MQLISEAVFSAVSTVVNEIFWNLNLGSLVAAAMLFVTGGKMDGKDPAAWQSTADGIMTTLATAFTAGALMYLGQGVPAGRSVLGVNPMWTNAILSGVLTGLLRYTAPNVIHDQVQNRMALNFLGNFLSLIILSL